MIDVTLSIFIHEEAETQGECHLDKVTQLIDSRARVKPRYLITRARTFTIN